MAKRTRRKFTDEFKADCVRLVRSGGRTLAQVTREFDLADGCLRDWVQQAEARDAAPREELAPTERAELAELRKRVKRLEMEREILKKATAFFAKENA
jgi:transposase-like protein